jgi:hypothetical protein
MAREEKYGGRTGMGFPAVEWGKSSMPDRPPNSEIPRKVRPAEGPGIKGPGPPDTGGPKSGRGPSWEGNKEGSKGPWQTKEEPESHLREGSEDDCPHCGKRVQVMGGRLGRPGDARMFHEATKNKENKMRFR